MTPAQRSAIVRLRLDNAEATLRDARLLLRQGTLRSVSNRTYYAAFYAVSALALHQEQSFKTHGGLMAFFHAEFVNTGRMDKRYGHILQEAFEDRSEADYEDAPELDAVRVGHRIENVDELIQAIRGLLCG